MPSGRAKVLDQWLVLATFALIIFGLLVLYAATSSQEAGLPHLFQKQLVYALIGFVLLVGSATLSPRVHFTFAYLIYAACCLGLLIVLIWGEAAKGAARWMNLGVFSFQPSEPAKVALVLALARLVTDKKYDPRKLTHLLKTLGLGLIPLGLVLAQPDLGTSIVFGAITLFIIVVSGTPSTYLLALVSPIFAAFASINRISFVVYLALLIIFAWRLKFKLPLLILLVLANLCISLGTPTLWNHLKPYQKNRLVSFIQPEADPRGSGYQVIQSKVAIGSGGFVGKGLGHGSQTQLKFLPEQHTDFIFSVVGEELGFVGSSVALALLSLVVLRGFQTAQKSKGRYSAVVCAGLSAMLAFHILINVGMAVGIMPVTGLPLPFLSYGGSFLWTTMISVGFVLGVQLRWREYTP